LETGVTDLPPLSRGYTRERIVVADIVALDALTATAFWQRLEISDYQRADCPRLESMVYWIRALCRRGRRDDAWRIAEILTRRIDRTVMQYLNRVYGLSRDQREEIVDELVVLLYEEWMSMDAAHEFWEVRFGVCLKRKLIDVIMRHRRVVEHEVVLSAQDGEDGTTDAIERMPDLSALPPETAAMARVALDSLTEPLRTAFYLHVREGWTEERIARALNCTSRTVRNYLSRARDRLAGWRDGE
jgi:RNA polymerase sigma factor (sigma-70 family)